MAPPLSTEFSKAVGFHVDSNLAKNLTFWRDAVLHQDIDCALFVDGKEGGGKSVLAQQIAFFLDVERKITLSQICFTPEEVKKAIASLPKGKALVYDEARRGINRRRGMSNTNLDLMDLLAECRQRNLFLVIVMPSFYDADMIVSVWRTRMLISVRFTWDLDADPRKRLVRGIARFYSENGKKILYCNNYYRRLYLYPFLSNDSFDFGFPHHYVVDEAAYREKKAAAMRHYEEETSKPRPPPPPPLVVRPSVPADLEHIYREMGVLAPSPGIPGGDL